MRRIYREKSFICGDYKEVYIYPCFADCVKKGRRRPKAKPTPAAQKKLNQRIRENNLIRLLNANFTAEDISFDLTYRDGEQPSTDEGAKKDVQNFLRRLKRYHHHLVLSGGVGIGTLAAIWGKGYTKAQPLQFDETGLIGKGKYLVKQAKGKDKQSQYFRSFYASKNLVHPQPRKRDGRFSQRKVRELCVDPCDRAAFERLYEGYAFSEAAEYYNDVNSGFYLEIRLYRKSAKLSNKRRR